MLNSITSTVDKSTHGSISNLESTPKPAVTTDQNSSSKYFENLQDATGNSAFIPVKRSLKDRLSAESTARKVKMTPREARKDTSDRTPRKKWISVNKDGRAARMCASYIPSEEDSKEERPESTPEQESKIQSLQTLVAKQNEEILGYQKEMTILQLEKKEILEEVCTLKRKIDELQGEDEVIMSVTKKVTGHTMKISAFWNLITFNAFKSVKRSSNSE